jgi:hypothetical protein
MNFDDLCFHLVFSLERKLLKTFFNFPLFKGKRSYKMIPWKLFCPNRADSGNYYPTHTVPQRRSSFQETAFAFQQNMLSISQS